MEFSLSTLCLSVGEQAKSKRRQGTMNKHVPAWRVTVFLIAIKYKNASLSHLFYSQYVKQLEKTCMPIV